jgi:hypothetical protein
MVHYDHLGTHIIYNNNESLANNDLEMHQAAKNIQRHQWKKGAAMCLFGFC